MALLDDIQEKVKVQPKKTSSDSTAQEQSSPASFQLKVGRTVTGLPGTPANVAVTGSQFQPTLNFVIPEGVQGDTGVPGAPGSSVNVLGELDNVSELPEGASQGDAYTIDGDLWVWTDDNDGAWNNAGPFRGPQGPAGPAGVDGAPGIAATISVGTVTTGAAGSNAAVQNVGNTSSAVFNFVIPRGEQGIQGPQGPSIWGGIGGDINTQTDLINLFNTKASNSAVVHLSETETISGSKTFTSTVNFNNNMTLFSTAAGAKLSTGPLGYSLIVKPGVNDANSAGVAAFVIRGFDDSARAVFPELSGGTLAFSYPTATLNGQTVWHTGNLDPNGFASNASVVLLTTNQTVAGIKTFSSNAVITGALFTAKQGRFDRGGAAADTINDLSLGNGTDDLRFHARLSAGSYNGLVGAGDKAIIFTNGTQNTGALTISPWASASTGLRIDGAGAHTMWGNLTFRTASGGALRLQTSTSTNSLDIGMGVTGTNDPDSFIVNRANGGIAFYTNNLPRGKMEANGQFTWSGLIVAGDGNGTESVRVGNDSSLWDVNIANTMGLKGAANQSLGYLKFGADPGSLGWDGTYLQYSGAALAFGATTRQMINLWQTTYGIGVQGNTLFQRTGNRFSWFKGGSFSVTENDPGTGGTVHMTLDGTGNLSVAGALTIGLTFTQSAGEAYFSSWIRSNTSGTGWYHQVHGGGWYMTDSSWIRSYGSKPVLITLAGGTFLRGETTSPTIEFYDTDQATTHWLHCNSNQFGFLQNNAFAWGAYRDPSNNWGCVGNVIAYASDRRLKTNIIDVPKSIVDNFFDKVRIRVFDWDAQKLALHKIGFEAKTEQVGAIAQEMREAFADAVVVNTAHNPIPTDNNPNPEKPDFLTIDWTKVVPLLVAEVQSLRARVSFLEAK